MDFKVIRDAKGNLIEDVTLEPYTITKSDNEKDIESVFKNYIEFVGWKQGVSYTRDRDKSSRYKFRNEHKGSTKEAQTENLTTFFMMKMIILLRCVIQKVQKRE